MLRRLQARQSGMHEADRGVSNGTPESQPLIASPRHEVPVQRACNFGTLTMHLADPTREAPRWK
ncbi:hypothetical protein TPA0910_29970 [Streptomyces hygroscopicus subsp. sporocinereus]|uniref:Uncharacterized protein n=1 Tax=Streptomyces hygroscopicus TaxID=1912 RepID=A0ABQ3TYV5_STRHY|nr:hypothetical protein TPA0910_29970 [Streptomyces hygroscopicus]